MAEATDRTASTPPSPSAPPHRSIRSYVRREGRITEAQQQALATWSERFCIGPGAEPLDFNAIFGRDAERYLEVGCGAGEVLIALASEHPENDYLGVEVYRPGLGRLLRGLAERELENVRILCGDAASLIEYQVSDQSLAGVYVFFPEPWPKKRHHKRRLMRPDFVALLRRKLCSHARVFLATDWEDYAQHIVQVMDEDGGFVNLAGRAVYAPRPRWRPLTRYEQRAHARGHRIREILYALA